MTTYKSLLEFTCHQLLGPPVYGNYWNCPHCDSDRACFSVRPPLKHYPVKFRCFRCDFWGDEYDLIRLVCPDEKPGRVITKLRAEYEEKSPDRVFSRGSGMSPHILVNEDGELPDVFYNPNYDHRDDEFSPQIDAVIKEFNELFGNYKRMTTVQMAYEMMEKALLFCVERDVHPEALAGRCGFEVWTRDLERRHLKDCQDPNCDMTICRRARGWSDAKIERAIKREKRQRERLKKAGKSI